MTPTPAQMPPGCKCAPEDWGCVPDPVCHHYRPGGGLTPATANWCYHCGHLPECQPTEGRHDECSEAT